MIEVVIVFKSRVIFKNIIIILSDWKIEKYYWKIASEAEELFEKSLIKNAVFY